MMNRYVCVLWCRFISMVPPLFLMLAFLPVGYTSFAQVKKKATLKGAADDTPAMYIKPDGNVGIGIINPTNKLELGGNLHMMGNRIYFYNEAANTSSFMQWNFTDKYNGANDNKLALAGWHGFKVVDVSHGTVPTLQAGFDVTPGVVDIRSAERSGTHPAPSQLSLYVTGPMDKNSGVEFRTSDGSKGLGFANSSIYTVGTGLQDLNLEVAGKKNLSFHTNGAERLRIDGGGNIWTNGNAIYFRGGFGDPNQFIKWRGPDNSQDANPTHDRLQIGGWNGVEIGSTQGFGSTALTVDNRGYVGLGVSQPAFPLHIDKVLGNNNRRYIEGADDAKDFVYYSSELRRSERKWGEASVFAMGDIVSHAGIVSTQSTNFSDIRLKKNFSASVAREDLNTLRQLEIVNYKMIDTIADNKRYKKVIAQQVKKVYPLAVDVSFNTLPDVFQKALSVTKIADTIYAITLAKPHGLKAGEVIELKSLDKTTINGRVTVIQSDKTFTVNTGVVLDGQSGIFVYGHKTNDVLTVDYDAISMLNVSATQQLANTVDEQQKEIALLKAQNAKLERENAVNKIAISLVLERLSRLEGNKTITLQPVLTASMEK